MFGLCIARLLIAWVPFVHWRNSLGFVAGEKGNAARRASLAQAELLAKQVERAAFRLPFEAKCLPRAMLLSWLLRRRKVGHSLVFAARPPTQRHGQDDLHAWVDVNGSKVIGDLPGPWIETLCIGK